jgi:hypothetical protein
MEMKPLPIQQDGNYLFVHGNYIEDWKDKEGLIWTILMTLPVMVVQAMLKTAFLNQGEGEEPIRWEVPNKGIIITQVDQVLVYAITARDGRFLLLKSTVERVKAHPLFGGPNQKTRRDLALEMLRV